MVGFPLLDIDLQIIHDNAKILLDLCRRNNIEPFAVIKGFNGINPITEEIVKAGYRTVGSSRIRHLKRVKEAHLPVETLALRIPMQSEVQDIVTYCDISLNSEMETLRLLDREAGARGRVHKVILMRDLGDLREGLIDKEEFVKTAVSVEKSLRNLHLYGIGANLTCYGSVVPTTQNLSVLAEDARDIEAAIGRKLEVVSGGNTSSIPLVVRGEMPEGINNLRIGEAIVLPCDLINHWKCPLPGLSNEGMRLKAEIIEIGEKPTHPFGELGTNCFGNSCTYEDKGVRRRALLAMGAFDFGDCKQLIPEDKDIHILGASSDHAIMDINDSKIDYQLGDIISFQLHYQAMLFATNNDLVAKCISESR